LETFLNTLAMDSLDLRVTQHDARLSVHGLLAQAQASLETDPDLALSLAKAAQNAAGGMVYLAGLAEALVLAGNAQHAQGQFKDAVESLSQARQLYVDLENPAAELAVLLELSRWHRTNGEVLPAGECLNRALDLSRQTGSRSGRLEWFGRRFAHTRRFRSGVVASVRSARDLEAIGFC
jgi:tetratricopeptide (TPR) repeat protein